MNLILGNFFRHFTSNRDLINRKWRLSRHQNHITYFISKELAAKNAQIPWYLPPCIFKFIICFVDGPGTLACLPKVTKCRECQVHCVGIGREAETCASATLAGFLGRPAPTLANCFVNGLALASGRIPDQEGLLTALPISLFCHTIYNSQ